MTLQSFTPPYRSHLGPGPPPYVYIKRNIPVEAGIEAEKLLAEEDKRVFFIKYTTSLLGTHRQTDYSSEPISDKTQFQKSRQNENRENSNTTRHFFFFFFRSLRYLKSSFYVNLKIYSLRYKKLSFENLETPISRPIHSCAKLSCYISLYPCQFDDRNK